MVSQPSDCLKKSRWPEEHLSSTAEEGGGFYPLRLGETLDERFVITRKLGWGGNSTVWLAKDDKYAPRNHRWFHIDKRSIRILKQRRSLRRNQSPISLCVEGN